MVLYTTTMNTAIAKKLLLIILDTLLKPSVKMTIDITGEKVPKLASSRKKNYAKDWFQMPSDDLHNSSRDHGITSSSPGYKHYGELPCQ